jgi:NTP pyrophosphatase (non-canonical NTP hydrolase)
MKADISTLLATVIAGASPIQGKFDEYQRGFFTDRPAEFFSLELCGEAGELANLEKKLWKGRHIEPDRLSDEAADVFIALMNYCNARGINIAESVAAKLERIEEMRFEKEEKGEKF